jgi:hypothetical protein
MNKSYAESLIEKENLRKEKLRIKMHNYRNSDTYREKNALYMKNYRDKQKQLLEEAIKVVENKKQKEEKIDSDKYKNKINVITKINKFFNKKTLNKSILTRLFDNSFDLNDEKYLTDNLDYLTDINNFYNMVSCKYKNKQTLKRNLYPFMLIFKNVKSLNGQYSSLKKYYDTI